MSTLSDAVKRLRTSNQLVAEEISDFEVWIDCPISELSTERVSTMAEVLEDLARINELLGDALRMLQDVNGAV